MSSLYSLEPGAEFCKPRGTGTVYTVTKYREAEHTDGGGEQGRKGKKEFVGCAARDRSGTIFAGGNLVKFWTLP